MRSGRYSWGWPRPRRAASCPRPRYQRDPGGCSPEIACSRRPRTNPGSTPTRSPPCRGRHRGWRPPRSSPTGAVSSLAPLRRVGSGRAPVVAPGVDSLVSPRAAFSHSASVGRRTVRPLISLAQALKAAASSQLTWVTGWSFLSSTSLVGAIGMQPIGAPHHPVRQRVPRPSLLCRGLVAGGAHKGAELGHRHLVHADQVLVQVDGMRRSARRDPPPCPCPGCPC